MRRKETWVENHVYRYLFVAYYRVDHQCSVGCRDAYHTYQLGVEVAHVAKTEIWTLHHICRRNAVSINWLVRTLERS